MYNVFAHSGSHMWMSGVHGVCTESVQCICAVQTKFLLVIWCVCVYVEVQCHGQLRMQVHCLPQSIATAWHCPIWQYKFIYSYCPQQPCHFSCIIPRRHGAWLVSLQSYCIRRFLQHQRDQHVMHSTLFIWYPYELSSYQGLVSVQLSCLLSMNHIYISYLLSFLKHKEGSWHYVSTSKLIYEDSCLLGCEWLLMFWKPWVLQLSVSKQFEEKQSVKVAWHYRGTVCLPSCTGSSSWAA
jgi:hypothetical protein